MQRLLIVEGEEDRKFFEAVFRSIGQIGKVEIRHHPSGKSNAIQTFGARLDLLTRASKDRIGLAVDADDPHLNASDGFENTLSSVNQQLHRLQFSPLTQGQGTSGFISKSSAFATSVAGLWVMPDNSSNGYLEDFASSVAVAAERDRALFAWGSAESVLNNAHGGPPFSFKTHHLVKAGIGTWFAWSDPPRMNLGTAVSRGLLDLNHTNFQALKAWINLLYFI